MGIEEQSAGVDAGAPGAAFGELGAVGTATLCARSKHVGSREPGIAIFLQSGLQTQFSTREYDEQVPH